MLILFQHIKGVNKVKVIKFEHSNQNRTDFMTI